MDFESLIDRVYKEREDRRKFLSNGQMMFAAVNKENKFVYFSDSWMRCLQLGRETLKKIDFTLLIHPDDLERSIDAYNFYKETGKFAIKLFSNRYRRADGTYANIQWFGGDHDDDLEISMTSASELPKGQKGFTLYDNGYEPFKWKGSIKGD